MVSIEADFNLVVNHLLIRRLSASLPQAILLLLLHALPVLPLATLQIAVLGSQQARERRGVGLWTFTRDVRLVRRAHSEQVLSLLFEPLISLACVGRATVGRLEQIVCDACLRHRSHRLLMSKICLDGLARLHWNLLLHLNRLILSLWD